MEHEEPTRVPKQAFRLLKTKLTRQIRILEAHFAAFEADGTLIKTAKIQQTLNQAFDKC